MLLLIWVSPKNIVKGCHWYLISSIVLSLHKRWTEGEFYFDFFFIKSLFLFSVIGFQIQNIPGSGSVWGFTGSVSISITLHYITLHYITLHQITLHHHITVHSIRLHYFALNQITLHCTPSDYIKLHSTTFHYTIKLHYITLHPIRLHYFIYYSLLNYIALQKAMTRQTRKTPLL